MTEGVIRFATLTTTAHSGVAVLADLDRTFCGSHISGGAIGSINQPRLDIPGENEMNGSVMVLRQRLINTLRE